MVHSVMLLTVRTAAYIVVHLKYAYLQGYQVDVELIDSSVWTGVLRTVSPEVGC